MKNDFSTARRQIGLQGACMLLGRWARYELTAACQLPLWCIEKEPKPVSAYETPRFTTPEDEAIDSLMEKQRLEELCVVEPFVRMYRGPVKRQTIRWHLEPNHSMRPVNLAARLIKRAFLKARGDLVTPPPVVRPAVSASGLGHLLYTSQRKKI